MGIVTGIPDGTDLSGNVTSPANAGGVSGFDSDFFQATHEVIFNILNKSISG
ncbi:pilus assembly protein, partial [Salmonella enterica subsp. enterica serovar Typhimurium]|nr:pilus assembly protein [Salmonella enterica subsp. enterica serovar Typhimurium]